MTGWFQPRFDIFVAINRLRRYLPSSEVNRGRTDNAKYPTKNPLASCRAIPFALVGDLYVRRTFCDNEDDKTNSAHDTERSSHESDTIKRK